MRIRWPQNRHNSTAYQLPFQLEFYHITTVGVACLRCEIKQNYALASCWTVHVTATRCCSLISPWRPAELHRTEIVAQIIWILEVDSWKCSDAWYQRSGYCAIVNICSAYSLGMLWPPCSFSTTFIMTWPFFMQVSVIFMIFFTNCFVSYCFKVPCSSLAYIQVQLIYFFRQMKLLVQNWRQIYKHNEGVYSAGLLSNQTAPTNQKWSWTPGAVGVISFYSWARKMVKLNFIQSKIN